MLNFQSKCDPHSTPVRSSGQTLERGEGPSYFFNGMSYVLDKVMLLATVKT